MRRVVFTIAESVWLWLGGILAAYIRLSSSTSWEIVEHRGWLKLLLMVGLVQVSFYLFDLYDLRSLHRPRVILENMAKAFAVTAIVVSVIFYAVPSLLLGRGVFVLDLVIGVTLAFISRLAVAWYIGQPHRRARERVLILGSGKLAIEMARATLERPGAGYFVVGFVDDKPELLGKSLINPSVIGLSEELGAVVDNHRVDRIVVAVEDRRRNFPTGELLNLRLSGRVSVEESGCFYERLTGKIAIDMIRPSWLIFSGGGRYSNFEHKLRRLANVLLAGAGALISTPVMALVAIAVKLDSRGPVFYVQERVGQNDRPFRIIKFRSMRVEAEQDSGPVWASVADPRVTRVGRIIRKLRLDELPQFINVLRGDMNFVGPRPERPEFVSRLSAIIPYYSQRHLVRPGLTGWAQVKYPYGASAEDSAEKLRYDLYYIKNQSWFLDLVIIFETIKIVLFGRGAR
ncbi:MAG TPA: TIGR03013 family XrtA/PEP-CTERM system glycosyltransferase [Blastocatellia bacterium]|nr:TIGR03013 family XrtA/PEP-CTERM system glycosyltransferase [Blastocatellia bacterium]